MKVVATGTWRATIYRNVRENWFIYSGQFFLAILVGARDLDVGTDTLRYAEWYAVIADCYCLWGTVEPGFNVFSLIISLISDSTVFYFFVISMALFIMTNVISGKVVNLDSQLEKKNKQLISALILMAFLVSPFFVSAHINAIRQGMAAFIVFYAFLSFYDRSWVKFLIASVLAISIHTTSIMYLVLFPLLLIPFHILFAMSVGLSITYASGFSEVMVMHLSNALDLPLYDFVAGYQENQAYQSGVRYDFLIFSWLGLCFALIGRYFSNKKKVITSLLSVYIILMIPFLILGFANFSNRYAYTAWLFLSVLTAYAAYSIPVWEKLRVVVSPYALILGSLAFLLMALNGFAR
ncbi:MAG: EpsG family protein [Methylophaga sp.]